MYHIKRCKECGQRIHIRQKGNKTIVKNKCIHFNDIKITRKVINELTIPQNQYKEPIRTIPDRHLCVLHCIPMRFIMHLRRFTDLYYCPKCAEVDILFPTKYINWWKKRTHNLKWKLGDVKLINSPDYETMRKMRWI